MVSTLLTSIHVLCKKPVKKRAVRELRANLRLFWSLISALQNYFSPRRKTVLATKFG